jgi:hypothetical protein
MRAGLVAARGSSVLGDKSARRPDRLASLPGYRRGSHSGPSWPGSCASRDRVQGRRSRLSGRHRCRPCGADGAASSHRGRSGHQGARPHASPCLRVQARQRWSRYARDPGLSRSPQHSEHDALYRLGAAAVQGIFSGLNPCRSRIVRERLRSPFFNYRSADEPTLRQNTRVKSSNPKFKQTNSVSSIGLRSALLLIRHSTRDKMHKGRRITSHLPFISISRGKPKSWDLPCAQLH